MDDSVMSYLLIDDSPNSILVSAFDFRERRQTATTAGRLLCVVHFRSPTFTPQPRAGASSCVEQPAACQCV